MDGYKLVCLFVFSVVAFRTCQPTFDGLHDMTAHSRRKRYLVFPDGSTFSIAFCNQWFVLNNNNIFSEALNFAVSYELPNETIRNPDTNSLVVPYLLRRQRRELYRRLEVAMNSAGLDGRICIKRALCEAAQRLKKSKESISEEFLRIVFLFPLDEVDIYEPIEHHIYDAAYRRGLSNRDCPELYSTCPFSLIDVFLGGPTYE